MSDSLTTNEPTGECREIRDLIPLFPADLEESEAGRVRDHVAACAACAAELGVYMAQAACFVEARATRGAPKLDLWTGVQARLREDATATPRGGIVVTFASLLPAARTAIAAGLLVGLGFLAAQRGSSTGPAVEPPKNPIAVKPTPSLVPSTPSVPAHPTRRRGPAFFEERATPVLPSGVPVIRANDGFLDEEAELPSAGAPRRWLDSQPGSDDDRSRSF